MTILNKTPVTLAEVQEIVKPLEERQEVKDYLKKFTKLSKDKADKLKQELIGLNSAKLREDGITKIVDFLPEDAEDVGKILNDVSLNEEEANAILSIVQKY